MGLRACIFLAIKIFWTGVASILSYHNGNRIHYICAIYRAGQWGQVADANASRDTRVFRSFYRLRDNNKKPRAHVSFFQRGASIPGIDPERKEVAGVRDGSANRVMGKHPWRVRFRVRADRGVCRILYCIEKDDTDYDYRFFIFRCGHFYKSLRR